MKVDIHTHSGQDFQSHLAIHILPLDYEFNSPPYSFCYGIHPWDIENIDFETFESRMRNFVKNDKFFALGEIGLDKVRGPKLELQIKSFELQVKFAIKENINIVIVHCVRAYSEVFDQLVSLNYKGTVIIHDFNSTPEMAKQYLGKFNTYFSFGVKLKNIKTNASKSIGSIPINRVFLETDDQNDFSIQDVYKFASDILNLSITELELQLSQNFKELTQLKS
jgi:TatD DNase family protein